MKTVFALCAESAIIDQQTNKLSILSLIEELSGSIFPAILQTVSFVVVLTKESSEKDNYTISVSISHNKKELFSTPFKVSFAGNNRFRALINIQSVPVPGAGDLMFSAKLKNKILGSWTIPVKHLSQASIAAVSNPIASGSGTTAKSAAKKKKAKKKAKKR